MLYAERGLNYKFRAQTSACNQKVIQTLNHQRTVRNIVPRTGFVLFDTVKGAVVSLAVYVDM